MLASSITYPCAWKVNQKIAPLSVQFNVACVRVSLTLF